MGSPQREVGYVELIRGNANFRMLYLARLVSLFGDWFNLLAALALLRAIGADSAGAFGGVLILKMLPSALLAPVAGVVADRVSRRSLMIVADVVRAVIVAGMLSVLWYPEPMVVYVLLGLQSAVSVFFEPARSAMLPDIVSPEELTAANALGAATWSTMLALGSAIGGVFTATVGWHAGRALDGDPSPLEQEVEAIRPGWAVVMYGTNDINIVTLEDYAENMLDLTDALLDRGVVPLLTTIMPRGDDPDADAEVPDFNMALRAIAEARQVPLIDYHRELVDLPDQGLSADGIHPSVLRDPGARACVLNPEGLAYGYNVRNLVTLEALDRVRRAVVEGEGAPDPAGPALEGDGSPTAPWVIDRLPFAHVANTLFSDHRELDLYDGCMADQDESGPEYLYRLELERATSLRIFVFDRGDVDIDLHVLDAPTEAGCVQRAHRQLDADLGVGTWYLALDTFVGSREQAGEYVLAIMER